MAKAKKTTTPTPDAAGPKKKAAAKAKPPATPPMVDTTLAAQSAARGLVAGLGPTAGGSSAGKESASFKQLKNSLSHPATAGLDSLLDKTALPNSRKPNVPFGGNKSTGGGGRNQTFGADVSRTGVPRRTSGG